MLKFADEAWDDYLYWQKTDKKILTRIHVLIKDVQRNPFDGLGDPEPLKHQLQGFWSRRINREHRLIYQVEQEAVYILQCRYHY